jgi:hypothetical protein
MNNQFPNSNNQIMINISITKFPKRVIGTLVIGIYLGIGI